MFSMARVCSICFVCVQHCAIHCPLYLSDVVRRLPLPNGGVQRNFHEREPDMNTNSLNAVPL
jgi:hypothetical protein